MEKGKHISRQFDYEMGAIKDQLMHMGALIEELMTLTVEEVVTLKADATDKVRHVERELNTLEVEIDQECSRVLVIRHPTAKDLRFIIAASKMAAEFESIGDELKKLVSYAHDLAEKTENNKPDTLLYPVREILTRVQHMFRNALDAFARLDVQTALAVIEEEHGLDSSYRVAMRAYISQMIEDPRTIAHTFDPIWMIRALERIGKSVRQCALHMIYLSEGKDLRHNKLETIKKEGQ